MDGRSDRRARRSARPYPRELRPYRLLRCRWRGLAVSQLAAAPAVTRLPHSKTGTGTGRFARIRLPSVRDVAADSGHDRRNVFAQTRHHGFARNSRSAISSALLLPARCRHPDRGPAGADRRRHRPRRQDHGRASHLARPVRPRQGTCRHAAARDGSSPRARRAVRCGDRCHGSWRRSRDHAVAAQHSAGPAHARRPLGQSPRRHPVPGNASPPLHCVRP